MYTWGCPAAMAILIWFGSLNGVYISIFLKPRYQQHSNGLEACEAHFHINISMSLTYIERCKRREIFRNVYKPAYFSNYTCFIERSNSLKWLAPPLYYYYPNLLSSWLLRRMNECEDVCSQRSPQPLLRRYIPGLWGHQTLTQTLWAMKLTTLLAYGLSSLQVCPRDDFVEETWNDSLTGWTGKTSPLVMTEHNRQIMSWNVLLALNIIRLWSMYLYFPIYIYIVFHLLEELRDIPWIHLLTEG